jgi:hypothetical protein
MSDYTIEIKDIDIYKVKSILLHINPEEYYTNIKLADVFKSSINFLITLVKRDQSVDFHSICLTFDWLDSFKYGQYKYQTWYVSIDEYHQYVGICTRIVLIEKVKYLI